MGKSFEVRGVSDVLTSLDKLTKKTELAVKTATSRMASEAEREVKHQIKGHHKEGTKTPSAVGSPPTNITGTLRASVTHEVKKIGFAEFYAWIGPTAVYGRAVELGAPNWESGVTYPFVAPAAKKLTESGKLREIYVNTLKSILYK